MEAFLFTDWASRWNPWESWWGFIAYNKEKQVLFVWSKYFWIKTNNQAEYLALIEALKKSFEFWIKKLNIFMDSELIVRQLERKYKVKNQELKVFFDEVINLLKNFDFKVTHVERRLNKDADKLANEAIDKKL